jgi:polyisoprenoid-binding protein YceI
MLHRYALVAALALATFSVHATTYTLEPNYTQGIARWVHLGFANPSMQFGQGEGTLEFDPADPAKASVTVMVPLDKFTTTVPDLDEHLRSADFFETAKYPTATFKSTRVEKGAATDRYKVSGELELHGVRKPVVLDVRFNNIGVNPRNNLPTIGFDGTTILKRSDFGLSRFVPQVSDEIRIEITAEAAEAKSYAALLKKEAAEDAAEKAAKAAAKKN